MACLRQIIASRPLVGATQRDRTSPGASMSARMRSDTSLAEQARRDAAPAPCEPPPASTDAVKEAADLMDRGLRAAIARATLGLSPAALAGAYLDWAAHLS